MKITFCLAKETIDLITEMCLQFSVATLSVTAFLFGLLVFLIPILDRVSQTYRSNTEELRLVDNREYSQLFTKMKTVSIWLLSYQLFSLLVFVIVLFQSVFLIVAFWVVEAVLLYFVGAKVSHYFNEVFNISVKRAEAVEQEEADHVAQQSNATAGGK